MDEHNLKLFIICTHSVVGALPLGIIITSDETTETLVAAFSICQGMLPEDAFFYSGDDGPAVFMTDNCSELRDALHAVWPKALLLLCLFHIMQQVWRWLCEGKNKISLPDRKEIMLVFKDMSYEPDAETFKTKYDQITENDTAIKYPHFLLYLDGVYEIRNAWALCYRNDVITRSYNTNNNAEAQFLVMKDKILQRVKEFNVISLFSKLVNDFTEHYKNKLLSVASGSYDGYTARRFEGKSKYKGVIGYTVPDKESVQIMEMAAAKIGNYLYKVPSESQSDVSYVVDTFLGICECPVGKSGAPCKHQFVLWTSTQCPNPNFLPFFNREERMKFAEIAIGKAALVIGRCMRDCTVDLIM